MSAPSISSTNIASELEMLAKALLEYETLSGDEIKKGHRRRKHRSRRLARVPRRTPSAGSSIPKAKRPKPGAIGGPAAAWRLTAGADRDRRSRGTALRGDEGEGHQCATPSGRSH